MATAVLNCATRAVLPIIGPFSADSHVVGSGDPDIGRCMQTPSDGMSALFDDGSGFSSVVVQFFDDGVTIPSGATVNSVQFGASIKGINYSVNFPSDFGGPQYSNPAVVGIYQSPFVPDPPTPETRGAFATYLTAVLTVKPGSGLPWTRADLFGGANDNTWEIDIPFPLAAGSGNSCEVDHAYLVVDYTPTVVGPDEWWHFDPIDTQQDPPVSVGQDVPTVGDYLSRVPEDLDARFPGPIPGDFFFKKIKKPGPGWKKSRVKAITLDPGSGVQGESLDIAIAFKNIATPFVNGTSVGSVGGVGVAVTATVVGAPTKADINGNVFQQVTLSLVIDPAATISGRVISVTVDPGAGSPVAFSPADLFFVTATPPDPPPDGWYFSVDGFVSDAVTIGASVPHSPRSYHRINVWAVGSAAWLGGFPGLAAKFHNQFVYISDLVEPTIRVFDGIADRKVVTLPPAVSGVTPLACMTLLTANGRIFVTSLDSGTTSTTWLGRVFDLALDREELRQIGGALPAGHVPYALAWHMGRLWVGTNRQDPTAPGRVYFLRPDLDLTFTMQHDLTTDGVGGVSSMLDYHGALYVGTTAPNAVEAKILRKDPLGVWTLAFTASGTPAANNGFSYLVEFQGNLYAAYWNGTAQTLIHKYDGTTWTLAYTWASPRPIIGMFVADDVLYAIGGSSQLQGGVLRTDDGTTWLDESSHLQGSFTALPAFAAVRL
jgi:hypothetical protein